jgi:hypothetical protein
VFGGKSIISNVLLFSIAISGGIKNWMSRIRDPREGPDIILSPSVGIYRTMDLGPTCL